jgi:hypothetical protein
VYVEIIIIYIYIVILNVISLVYVFFIIRMDFFTQCLYIRRKILKFSFQVLSTKKFYYIVWCVRSFDFIKLKNVSIKIWVISTFQISIIFLSIRFTRTYRRGTNMVIYVHLFLCSTQPIFYVFFYVYVIYLSKKNTAVEWVVFCIISKTLPRYEKITKSTVMKK